LKISVLVAQYFYQNKRLNLPGIGTFFLDVAVDVQNIDKGSRDLLDHIHFAQKAITRPDEELIDFIRKHTGKIRPLAESDLETFVADGKLMLNIGKPFHIEGIGTLQKNREGIYEFSPGQPVVQRLESPPALTNAEHLEDRPKKKSVFDEDPNEARNAQIRRVAIIIGAIIGISIIVWGGYSLFSSKVKDPKTVTAASSGSTEDTQQQTSEYLSNLNDPKKALENVINKDSVLLDDVNGADTTRATSSAAPAPASTTPAAPVATGPQKMYKYVLQTTKSKTTAIGMLNRLKPKVQLETVDSTLFKIVISLPGTPADTTRIKDSLRYWYWGARDRQVTIE
jgi:hypothetical protein